MLAKNTSWLLSVNPRRVSGVRNRLKILPKSWLSLRANSISSRNEMGARVRRTPRNAIFSYPVLFQNSAALR